MKKIQSASEELKNIAKSKRIPNAILLSGNGKNKLRSALDFCKTILTEGEEGDRKLKLEKMCESCAQPPRFRASGRPAMSELPLSDSRLLTSHTPQTPHAMWIRTN